MLEILKVNYVDVVVWIVKLSIKHSPARSTSSQPSVRDVKAASLASPDPREPGLILEDAFGPIAFRAQYHRCSSTR